MKNRLTKDDLIVGVRSSNPEEYVRLFHSYLNAVKKVNGVLVLDFHQEHFSNEVAPGINVAYRSVLEFLKKDSEVHVDTINNVVEYLQLKSKI